MSRTEVTMHEPDSSDSSPPAPARVPDAEQWYFAAGVQPTGPVSLADIETRLRDGSVRRHTLVWTPGMSEWASAASIGAFLPLLEEFERRSGLSSATPGALGAPLRPPTVPGEIRSLADRERSLGERMLLPVGRSGFAIAAGYCGLFALFPFIGGAAGPAGVALGLLALRDINRHEHRHGRGRAWFGIIAGGLSTLAHLAIVILMLVH